MRYLICFVMLFVAFSLSAKEKSKTDENGLGFGAIPALGFDADFGAGFGAVVNIYRKSPTLKPYKYSVMGQAFMTTKKVQSHYLLFDALDIFGKPLRSRSKLGFAATPNIPFCGFGASAPCVDDSNDKTKDLIRQFETYFITEARWRLKDLPNKVELTFGWRGSYYVPGDWKEDGAYPNSTYAEKVSKDGEKGFASVLEAGVMFDGRDNEPDPRSGYWHEVTVRASSPVGVVNGLMLALMRRPEDIIQLIKERNLYLLVK